MMKQPRPLTAATKCPRLNPVHEEVAQPKRKPKRPKPLSALQEICTLQSKVDPILPWLPFVRLVHELLFEQGPYRIQKRAIHALWEVAEQHMVKLFERANLACMHSDRCTITSKDIRLLHRLRGDTETLGEPVGSEEVRKKDRAKFNEGRLSISEAIVADTRRKQKLCQLIVQRRHRALKAMRR